MSRVVSPRMTEIQNSSDVKENVAFESRLHELRVDVEREPSDRNVARTDCQCHFPNSDMTLTPHAPRPVVHFVQEPDCSTLGSWNMWRLMHAELLYYTIDVICKLFVVAGAKSVLHPQCSSKGPK